jgi:peptidoglycan hydrolase CwlO-like protein
MLLKDRVKQLRLENEDLAEKIEFLETKIDYVNNKVDDFAVNSKGYTDTAVQVVIDAVNNQHRSLREEKAELETKYTKAVSALRFLLTSSSSGDVITPQGLSMYLMKTLGEINE